MLNFIYINQLDKIKRKINAVKNTVFCRSSLNTTSLPACFIALIWEQRVASSNPAAPTNEIKGLQILVCRPFPFLGILPHFLPHRWATGAPCRSV